MLELVSTPDGLKAYRDWCDNPVTRRVYELARQESSPRQLSLGGSSVDAAYSLGVYTGYDLLLKMVFQADAVANSEALKKQLQALMPTYGATAEAIKREMEGHG